MLQQRKLAWIERKKKPKNEMTAGKGGGNTGKVSSYAASRFHKTSNYRQHESSKMTYGDGNSTNLLLKGGSGGGRTFRKCSVAVSQFLPPIKTMTMESNQSLVSKQSSVLFEETSIRETIDGDVQPIEGSLKYPDKYTYQSTGQKDTLFSGSSPRCMLSKSVNLPCSWEQKTFVVKELVDLMKPTMRKAPTPDLYKSCFLVLSSRGENEQDCRTQQVPEIFRHSIGRSQVRCKTPRRGLSTWKSTNQLKGVDKPSSRDSAFGTDTWSENAEVDIELDLEVGNLEMDYYTHQRILNWILQVNAALFSPSADSLKCHLTEQDTSIKIVYDGD